MYFSGTMAALRFIYNLLMVLSWNGLKVVALFKPKIRLFVSGRKKTFLELEKTLSAKDRPIWMHVASLGEFEQGLPVLEQLRSDHPNHKIVLSFFSPSGYEVKKNTPIADVVVYLPMDTLSNARRFLDAIKPDLAIFVKYEIWPNYLHELQRRTIPTLLVSAIFSKRQIFFKPFGGYMRNSLKAFSHFFVQNADSKKLLESIGFDNITISGDTRFDRVSQILGRNNRLDFMDDFKGDLFCLVAGSTWPEDEEILIDYINASQEAMKFVIAPHEIKSAHIDKLENAIHKRTVRYSKIAGTDLTEFEVILIDTIGLLTKIYSYADIAYVGGGFATGLHNTLEPAVYGIPVIIGPNYKGFKEAEDLVEKNGLLVIMDREGFHTVLNNFLNDSAFRKKTGEINSAYIRKNTGATNLIVGHINQLL
ncbi:MAG: glycosyltransferase N-terminal domain-containing protein [Allomuricauda sp.]